MGLTFTSKLLPVVKVAALILYLMSFRWGYYREKYPAPDAPRKSGVAKS